MLILRVLATISKWVLEFSFYCDLKEGAGSCFRGIEKSRVRDPLVLIVRSIRQFSDLEPEAISCSMVEQYLSSTMEQRSVLYRETWVTVLHLLQSAYDKPMHSGAEIQSSMLHGEVISLRSTVVIIFSPPQNGGRVRVGKLTDPLYYKYQCKLQTVSNYHLYIGIYWHGPTKHANADCNSEARSNTGIPDLSPDAVT